MATKIKVQLTNKFHKTIMEMVIGERLTFFEELHVLRVPGGWIYTTLRRETAPASVFVPLTAAWDGDGTRY